MPSESRRSLYLFTLFLLLAGVVNLISRGGATVWRTMMICANDLIYIGLLLFWLQSVLTRLLHSRGKTYIVSAAFLMLLYILLRIFKYRFAVSVPILRYTAYAYWVPQLLIAALFLMTCICIWRGEQERGRHEGWLLVPNAALSLLVLTNDLHKLVYVFEMDSAQFMVKTGTYTYGPFFYLLYGWMILTTVLGLLFLFRGSGRMLWRAVGWIAAEFALWVGLLCLNQLSERYAVYRMFNMPEIQVFGMLGIFEICIQCRLIPYNENYSSFFRQLRLPVRITDKKLRPVYVSAQAIQAEPEELRASLAAPVCLPGEQVLYGKAVRGGYAFWVEDERQIRAVQEKLLEANELIEQENDLIRAETQQKEKDAYLKSRHRIYHEIARELYPVQKRIETLLNGAQPHTEDFRRTIEQVCVLNAYVKRKTNLLLLAAETDTLRAGELYLALQESAHYLTLAGLHTTAARPEETRYPAEQIIALYDSFEAIAEQLLGDAPSLMVSFRSEGLRLVAQARTLPDTSRLPLPVTVRISDRTLYMDITAEGGGGV